jgi:hypothetical protein
MKITELVAVKKTSDTVLLTWIVLPLLTTTEAKIYRRHNDADIYKLIGIAKGTAYIDRSTEIYGNSRMTYKVEIQDGYQEVRLTSHNDPFLYEAASQHLFALKEGLSGILSQIYCKSKETRGCPECYSEDQKKRIKSKCSTCDGSGFIHGYKGPIAAYINYQGERAVYSLVGNMSIKNTVIQAWTGNIPELSDGDIVVKSESERFIVIDKPVCTKMIPLGNKDNFIIRQTFGLELLPASHMAYKLGTNYE